MVTFESLGINTKGRTGRIYIPCPKCSATRKKKNIPCLTVNIEPENNWYNCHHCTFHGNLDQYSKYEKVRTKARMPSEIGIYSQPVIDMLLGPKGISQKTAKRRMIYEIAPFSEEKYGQVAFPYFYQGNLVNVKFRRLEYDKTITLKNGDERYLTKNWQLKKEDGAKVCYWGLNLLNWEESLDLIITEGETDALTWDECEFQNVLSVPNGAINENVENIEEKLDFAKDPYIIQHVYAKAKRVFLALDDDGPGKRMMHELAKIIGMTKCFIVSYKGRKDINEVYYGDVSKDYKRLGKEGVAACFADARPYPVGGIITFDMIESQMDALMSQGYQRGYTLGGEHSDRIDKLISIKAPYLAVITGIPSMGKTSWWRWYMAQQSIKNGLKWGLFVPDSRPEEREIAKICEVMAGAKWEKDKPWSMSDAQRKRAKDFVREFFYLIKPDRHNHELISRIQSNRAGEQGVKTLDSLFYYLETLKKQYNIFGYLFDAWNKVEHQKPNGMTDEQFVSKQLDRVLSFNEEMELFGGIIAHPTKQEKIKGSKNYEPPDLYNVKGSSAWYEKADIGVSIHRTKYRKVQVGTEGKRAVYKEIRDHSFPTEVIINKIKQQEIGEEGEISMFMDWKKAETFVYERPDYYEDLKGDELGVAKAAPSKVDSIKYDGPLHDDDAEGDDGEPGDYIPNIDDELPF